LVKDLLGGLADRTLGALDPQVLLCGIAVVSFLLFESFIIYHRGWDAFNY